MVGPRTRPERTRSSYVRVREDAVASNVETRRIDTTDVAVVIVGANRQVSYANAAAHRMLGRPMGSIPGRALGDMLVAGANNDLRGLDAAFMAHLGREGHASLHCADGTTKDVRMHFEPFAAPEGPIVAVSVAIEPVLAPSQATLLESEPHAAWDEKGSGARPIRAELPLVSQTIADVGPAPAAPAATALDVTVNNGSEPLGKDLQTLSNLLRWADHCLSSPLDAAGDLEGVRARARFVLEEARELLARCLVQIEAR
jgi:hypothetical protein